MSNRVISIVQLSAGTGRTTIATNLAGELARFNRVGLVDCSAVDATAAEWGALRQDEAYSSHLIIRRANTTAAMLDRVRELRAVTEYTVLDAPAHRLMTGAAVAISHLCLVPMVFSLAEHFDVTHTLDFVRDCPRLHKLRVRVVANRCPAGQREALLAGEEDRKIFGAKLLKAALTEREAYVEAVAAGRTAAETGDPVARDEVNQLSMQVRLLVRRASDAVAEPTLSRLDLNSRLLLRLGG